MVLAVYHFQLQTHPSEDHLYPIGPFHTYKSLIYLTQLELPRFIQLLQTQVNSILLCPLKPILQHNATLYLESFHVSS